MPRSSRVERSALRVARHEDVLYVCGALTDNRQHVHHAMQVVWAKGAPAVLETPTDRIVAPLLVVDGEVPHRLEVAEGLVALVENASAVAAALRHRWLDGAKVVGRPNMAAAPLDIDDGPTLLGELAGGVRRHHRLDPRIKRLLHWLAELEKAGQLPEANLAEAVARTKLSESRLLHLFRDEVGTPWRRYLVWRRALAAVQLATDGRTLTEVAHAAGYADSAHLSRQFAALFGYAPSVARRRSEFVQVGTDAEP